MKKTVFSIFLLIMLMIPPMAAFAEIPDSGDPVPYLDEKGTIQYCKKYIPLNGDMTTLDDGWYVLKDDYLSFSALNVDADKTAHLILTDGMHMRVESIISAEDGNLVIYAQSTDHAGQLEVLNVRHSNYSVHCRDLTVNGGNLVVRPTSKDIHSLIKVKSAMTVNGGAVTVRGTKIAFGGIGGDLTVNGGTVDVTTTIIQKEGAGIAGNVTVNGGVLNTTITGDISYVKGIYGSVTVNGGTVNGTVTNTDCWIRGPLTVNGGVVNADCNNCLAMLDKVSVKGGILTVRKSAYGFYNALSYSGGTVDMTSSNMVSTRRDHSVKVSPAAGAAVQARNENGDLTGSPFQSETDIAELLGESKELHLHMVTIGHTHTYGTPVYAWTDAICRAERSCTGCLEDIEGHTQIEIVTGSYVMDTPASCLTAETGHYRATFTNTAFAEQNTAANSVTKGTPQGHYFPDTWQPFDAQQHMRQCTREGCSAREYQYHIFRDGSCTVCGYEKGTAKVTWMLDGTTVLDITDVNTGEMPVHDDPAKTGYIFTGWDPALAPVTGDITYTAKFIKIEIEPPVITPEDAHVEEGKKATFKVKTPDKDLTYQWYIDRNDGKGWNVLKGATSATYTTSPTVLGNDGYRYKCVAGNAVGNKADSNIATLHVFFKPAPVPPTGDNNRTLLWLALLTVSGAALFCAERKRRQYR